jgi:hypothetical protein
LEKDWFTLLANAPGEYEVAVQFQVRTTEKDGDVGFAFSAPPSPMTQMRLRLGLDKTGVHAIDGTSIRVTRGEEALEAALVLRTSRNVAVGWRHPVAKKAARPVQPPRITSETSTLITVTEGYLDCASTLQYEVLRGTAETFSVVLPKEAIVIGVEGKGAAWTSTETENTQQIDVNVNHGVSGSYTLTLRYELPISDTEDSIVVPRLSPLDVARQTGYIAVTARGNVRVNIGETMERVSRVDVASLPTEMQQASPLEIMHAYKYTQPAYLVTLSARVEQPHVVSRTSTLLTVRDRVLSCATQIHYTVLRGEVNRLAFSLPETINLLDIDGVGAEWSSKVVAGRLEVTTNLNETVQERYVLRVMYEMPLSDASQVLTAPELIVQDTNRQTGHVGISTSGNIKIEADASTSGIIRVDETELPPALRQESAYPVLHAFQYFEPGYLLALDVQRLEDIAVRVVSIDDAELTTVITEEGLAITRARYYVRNHVSQFLRVKIAPTAEVWGAQVNGAPVTPARDVDESTVLLPLMKSVQRTGDSAPFLVELVYKEDIAPLRGTRALADLNAPSTDILANRVRWEVLLPESRVVRHIDGDLKAAAAPETRLRGDRGAAKPVGTRMIYRLREGIERFMITDINNPAGSAMGGAPRYTGELLPPVPTEPAAQRLAGVLPIRVKLPEVGTSHYFARTLVPKGEVLSLQLTTYDRRLTRLRLGFACVLCLLTGMALGRLVYGVRNDRSTLRKATAILGGLGLATVFMISGSGVTAQGIVLLILVGWAIETSPRYWKERQARRTSVSEAVSPQNEEGTS